MRKKGFTMIEIIIVTVITGVGLLSIVLAINKSKSLSFEIKQEIIANQLAKEGIELVYQLRNTNLLQHTGLKNSCWLNENPYENCNGGNNWLEDKNYIIKANNVFSGTDMELNLLDGIDVQDQQFAMCLINNKWISCPGQNNFNKYGSFFRRIRGIGLFDKSNTTSGGTLLNCPNGNTNNCSDDSPKEYRFCSEVYVLGEKTKSVEICSVITNFFN